MLQRVFLSHNLIANLRDVDCLFHIKFLIELSLDGNPVTSSDPVAYRNSVIMVKELHVVNVLSSHIH